MRAIAIDGPAGAGKSTIARELARRLGYIYVDTGALYRAIGLYCMEHAVPLDDPAAVEEALPGIRVALRYVDGIQRVLLGDRDVSEEIRRQEVSMAASSVSAMGAVRDFLFDLQRDLALEHDVVMDGRDIGTVVLPDADVKIYLTATAEERTRRRMAEYEAKGIPADFETLLQEVNLRDEQDKNRAVAPLKQAEDAIVLDSTHLDAQGVLEAIERIAEEKIG
ncbi:MAG: (d)CMP kinase [Clostridiales bacterium]|nr:(d)CMP kinase [Clostridiales bacterium]